MVSFFKGRAELAQRIDPASQSVSLCDLRRPGEPLIYVNKGFEKLTGYEPSEVVGRNCRFLQGKDTDPAAVAQIRSAIGQGKPLLVDLLNYRKDGRPFWNRLSLRPVTDATGAVSHYVGIQSDITALKELEAQLVGYARELGGHPRDA